MGRLWNMSGAQTRCKVTTPLGRTLAYLLAAQRETVSPFLPRSSNRSLGGGEARVVSTSPSAPRVRPRRSARGTLAQVLRLTFDFPLSKIPFAVDWVIIGLGSVGALGLVLGSRDIAYRGSWEKIVHGLIIVHLGIPWDGFRGSHPALLHAIP